MHPYKCHCERSEAISRLPRLCLAMTFVGTVSTVQCRGSDKSEPVIRGLNKLSPYKSGQRLRFTVTEGNVND